MNKDLELSSKLVDSSMKIRKLEKEKKTEEENLRSLERQIVPFKDREKHLKQISSTKRRITDLNIKIEEEASKHDVLQMEQNSYINAKPKSKKKGQARFLYSQGSAEDPAEEPKDDRINELFLATHTPDYIK